MVTQFNEHLVKFNKRLILPKGIRDLVMSKQRKYQNEEIASLDQVSAPSGAEAGAWQWQILQRKAQQTADLAAGRLSCFLQQQW